jgi:hypothetical protein
MRRFDRQSYIGTHLLTLLGQRLWTIQLRHELVDPALDRFPMLPLPLSRILMRFVGPWRERPARPLV